MNKGVSDVLSKRISISAGLRFEIMKRDGYRCQICGCTSDTDVLEIDHIHPVSKGGSNDPNNLQVLCHTCNNGKRTRHLHPEVKELLMPQIKTSQNIPEIRRVIVNRLDPYHKTMAEVLAERGEIRIIEGEIP